MTGSTATAQRRRKIAEPKTASGETEQSKLRRAAEMIGKLRDEAEALSIRATETARQFRAKI